MCVLRGLQSFYKCQTTTGDQGPQRHTHTQAHTLINTPEKAQKCHPEKRLITLRLISLRKKGCGGKKGAKEEEEGVREGRREGARGGGWGDYTIIQITAGYNLVADVSRSTMLTTHRRACVCAYTLTEFQCPASSHRGGKKRPLTNQHRLLNITALYRSVWESLKRKLVSDADETIYKNNDREPVFS